MLSPYIVTNSISSMIKKRGKYIEKRHSGTSALDILLAVQLTTRSSRRLTIFHTHEFDHQEYITARKRGGHNPYNPTLRLFNICI